MNRYDLWLTPYHSRGPLQFSNRLALGLRRWRSKASLNAERIVKDWAMCFRFKYACWLPISRFQQKHEGPNITMGFELSIVIPTYDERSNIKPLLRSLHQALANVNWEAVFVDDDSQDGTAAEIAQCVAQYDNVRLIQRIDRRGLSSACIDGMRITSSPFIAVMDADLQHDETIIPKMLEILKCGLHDVVVGSRYAPGGSLNGLSRTRISISKLATWIGTKLIRNATTDPMSGLFMIRQDVRDKLASKLSGVGNKLLFDILINGKDYKIVDVPYHMRERRAGESKFGLLVSAELVQLVGATAFGKMKFGYSHPSRSSR